MPWKDVVNMAAEVAKNGFNVTHDLGRYSVMYSIKRHHNSLLASMSWSHINIMCDLIHPFPLFLSLAEALAKVKGQTMSDAFRDLFLPNGQAPLSGLFTRRLDLAAILEAVAVTGISEFYSGNLTQEMAAAVRKSGFFPACLQLWLYK